MAAYSRCTLGQARSQFGHAAEGIALIRQGIDGLLEIGQRSASPARRRSWRRRRRATGAIGDALETVEQALAGQSRRTSHRPEALQLRGELRLILGQAELAEAGFREAIALAHKMSAKARELPATTSLAQMLAKHGRRDEARAMLAEIYGWFTEGFDTADLKDAKALLEEL